MADADRAPVHYRLRGDVGGALRSYVLRPGENSLGSTGGNTIVLPLRGVSRRHAVLTVATEGLTLEDMGSRNGTLVRGVRVQRTQLQAGDEIRVGPVTLRLEELDPDDATLAIQMGASPPANGLPDGDTTATEAELPGRLGPGFLEALIGRACQAPDPDLGGLAALLARDLKAESACVFEVSEGEPVAVAASGSLPDLGHHRGFLALIRDTAAAAGPVSASLAGDPPLACAVAGAGTERLGIVVAGEIPFRRGDVESILHLLVALLRRLRPRASAAPLAAPAQAAGLAFPPGYVPGESRTMRAFYAQMKPLAQGDLPVLLLGETGVGKEFLAHILHDSSRRRNGPFVAINCAAIPADLLEAEMFGIGKGVATGVVERRGKFQLAQGGTLFLDEIGDMPLELQAKLLRALQEKEVQPVGGAPVPVDIRVIAATNTDLHRRMEEGRFRRDLYFRVAGFALQVPPLRERREDVAGLVESFLRTFAREAGKSVHGLTVKALRALVEHDWPGNVRELQHEVRRLAYLCPDGQAIDSSMVSEHVREAPLAAPDAPSPETLDLERNVGVLERRLIREAMERSGGNRSQAARLLGISRNGLAIKMERLGLAQPLGTRPPSD